MTHTEDDNATLLTPSMPGWRERQTAMYRRDEKAAFNRAIDALQVKHGEHEQLKLDYNFLRQVAKALAFVGAVLFAMLIFEGFRHIG